MNDVTKPALSLEQPTLVRYKVLAWMCALSMITYIDRVCIKQVQEPMQNELGITPSQFAWVFSAFGLAYALFEVPSGWLGDVFGARVTLVRIVLWWSVFTALTGLIWPVPGWPLFAFAALLTVRFLFGMGEAGAYPNTARALRGWFPYSRRGLAQGLLWMFGRWGGAVAPLLIGVLALWFGWRGAFLVFALMGVAWVIGFWLWYRDTPRQHPSVNEAERQLIEASAADSAKPAPLSWRAMLRSPTLWCLCGMYFCSNAGWCFFITWDVNYHKQVLGLSGSDLQLASGAPLFFGGIACLLGGFLTDRQVRVWGRRWGRTLQGFAAYFLGGIFFFVALAVGARHALLTVAALCLASFLKDFAMAASWSTCIDIGHRYSGTVAGFMNMVGNLGTFFTPPIVAALAYPAAPELAQQAVAAQGLVTPGSPVALAPQAAIAAGVGHHVRFHWEVALLCSGVLFLMASVCWLFINPKRVIVYSPQDTARLQAEGILQGDRPDLLETVEGPEEPPDGPKRT
jgi:MFS family permease